MVLKSCMCLYIGVILSARMSLQGDGTQWSAFYIAAVVEYHPLTIGDNSADITNSNAKNYLKFLETANKHEVDIIVFPEYGLIPGDPDSYSGGNMEDLLRQSSYLPHPDNAKLSCDDNSSEVIQAVKDLSCAAGRYKIYVVVNLSEKVKCYDGSCGNGGHKLYNTNIVFDRTGILVAKYRKYHLPRETLFERTAKPELSTFETDFNVTFGQFISSDILFEEPSLSLLRKKKITDILFSSRWNSEMPFMTANALQTAWSFVNDVNFLCSGYNFPGEGSTGSGIYAGREGVLGRIWSEKRLNAIIISKIPKVINGRRPYLLKAADTTTIYYKNSEIHSISGYEWLKQQHLSEENLDLYKTRLLEPTNGTHTLMLCDRGLCCNFIVNVLHDDTLVRVVDAQYYRYRFAVFKGLRSFSNQGTTGVEICSVIACADESLATCCERFHEGTNVIQPTTFNSIEINGNFSVASTDLQLPISLTTNMQSLNPNDIAFTRKNFGERHAILKYVLMKPLKDLRTFAIYGRNFRKDGQPETSASISAVSSQLDDDSELPESEQTIVDPLQDSMTFELNHQDSSTNVQTEYSVSSRVNPASTAQSTITVCYSLLIISVAVTIIKPFNNFLWNELLH